MNVGANCVDLLTALRTPRGKVVELRMEDNTDFMFARVQLALAVKCKGLAFVLRAIVEDWDLYRLVRETY